jgi:tol-pal system protein YbgF
MSPAVRTSMSTAFVAIAGLALVATGCASRASLQQTQHDMTALRAEVTGLRRSHEVTARELARTAKEVRAMESRSAELQTALGEQSAEAARLRTRLDAAEQELQAAKAQIASQTPGTRSEASGPPAAAPTSDPSPQRPGAVEPDDAKRAYDGALANFRAREHGQAVLDFMDFVATYPAHPLAPNAQYWIGEAYYVQRDYRQAVVEFQRVIDMAPSSSKAADALLRMGLAHTNLRENSRAQQAWQRVARDYPATDSAGRARALLREHAARRP